MMDVLRDALRRRGRTWGEHNARWLEETRTKPQRRPLHSRPVNNVLVERALDTRIDSVRTHCGGFVTTIPGAP